MTKWEVVLYEWNIIKVQFGRIIDESHYYLFTIFGKYA
jgi:hypothetical protein